ncbi:MAG: FG-GAP-like repeat-containing protein, partial [Ignavibacteriaceae bacterium]|nr:FG-GAP-like repeat-containing protein [Ignavibacteriaceae bacterium]
MKYLFLLFVVLPMWVLNAQPLNGNYTVGGSSPDFLTLQLAADALNERGVSGPVFFNIRPGIYSESGGNNNILLLDGTVTGLSADNRVTFQPDENAGGNVENVILRIDRTTQTSEGTLVHIKIDHITIRNLTLEDVDSSGFGADILISIDQQHGVNPITEDVVIEGCRFIGNPHPTGGMTYGTDYGVYGSTNVAGITIRQNLFMRFLRAVEIGGDAGSNGSVNVEDNQFLNAHWGNNYSGYPMGHIVNVKAYKVIIRRNYLNNDGSTGSIFGIIVQADSGLIERNIIKDGGGSNGQVPSFRAIVVGKRIFSSKPLSMLIVNNMITGSRSVGGWGLPLMGRYGIMTETKAQIIHNTIVHPVREQISGGISLGIGADSSTVLNNIVIDYGRPVEILVRSIVLYEQTVAMSGLISDYNVFFYDYNQSGVVYLAAVGSNLYTGLTEFQTATGLDSNSISKEIYFETGENYPHLSDCQAQDPELGGIPYPGIVDDIDGDLRSLTAPTRGADEGRLRSNPMFEDVFRKSLPGVPTSIAFGKFDNLIADGLAVADHENEQILLFHNMPSTRSFLQYGILNVGFKPNTLAFNDFDDDGELDLIVGGESSLIKVFWGDGVGGFPESSEEITLGGTFHLVPEPYQLYEDRKMVFIAHPSYQSSIMGIVEIYDNRQLCYDLLYNSMGIDSIPWGPWSIVVDDIGGDNYVDFAGLSPLGYFTSWEFHKVNASVGTCGPYYFATVYPYHQINLVGGNYTYQNSLILGDFDDDSDKDFVITGYSDNECNLLRNEGNFNFQPEPMAVNNGRGFAKLDYENDGDLDFVSVNWALEDNGITLFLNDGTGHFTPELNCFQSFATGIPHGVVAHDFDLDG